MILKFYKVKQILSFLTDKTATSSTTKLFMYLNDPNAFRYRMDHSNTADYPCALSVK